jgi:two-component sensor histidine kinase
MKWRGHLDLPKELAGILPPILTQLIVALAGIGAAVGLRVTIEQIVPNLAPFPLTFPVIVAVTLVAGARAGLITLVCCQLLVWYAILPPQRSFAIESVTVGLNLILITAAQLVMLWALGFYRRIVIDAQDEDRQRIDDLSLTLREIDHRTKNNFQLAIGLLEIQARNAKEQELRSSLNRAATRLQAISGVYKNLALSSADLEAVRLHDYLRDLCDRLREGLLSPAIVLTVDAQPVMVSHDLAVRIGLIVNELLTNATKHAFPEGIGSIVLRLEKRPNEIELVVSDDGKGIEADGTGEGLGTKLIAMLIRQIRATMMRESRNGTTYRLTIPLPDK